jgi:hypothetical protein
VISSTLDGPSPADAVEASVLDDAATLRGAANCRMSLERYVSVDWTLEVL